MPQMMSQTAETHGHISPMSGNTLTIGQRIKRARLAIGMGQNEMAKAVGVEGVTAYRWESGRATPTLERIAEIANVLGVSVADLVPDDYDEASAEDEGAASVDDGPDEMMRFVELAAAASRGGSAEKEAFNRAVSERAQRLRAERAEKRRS